MLLRCLKLWISVLAIFSITVESYAQCFSFTQSQIPPNSSFVVPLNIEGAALDDLSDINQCVEAVALSFSHPRLSELEIFLISPFGDTIALVSGGGSTFAATNNTNWNITFLPCSETAFPDNDFNPNFTNTENWGVFGNYSGLYYPFEDCLEDFDQGPVNGTWQLLIINNSEFNTGLLTGFSLFFCNGDGLDCFICQAVQSSISLDSESFCQGSPDLLLDFDRSFIGLAPDPGEYGYDYLLFQDSVLLNSGPFLDLRDSASGEYTVCGLSYLLEDTMLLISEGDKIDFDEYRFTLTSDTAAFCGRLSNCIHINISEPIDTTYENRYICQGDTLFIGLDTLLEGGIYDIMYQSGGACDSVVQVDLMIIDFELSSGIAVGLDCNTLEQTLFPIITSTNVDPLFLTYVWTGPMGDTLSLEDSLVVDMPGIYELEVVINIDGVLLCTFQSIYTVSIVSDEYDPTMILPEILCPLETYEITIDNLVPGTVYSWSVSPDQDIVGPMDSSVFTFIVSNADEIEICVLLENDCFQDTSICNSLPVNQLVGVNIFAQDTICGLSTIINTSGLEEISAIVVAGPSMNVDFDIMASDILVSIIESGEYTIEVYGLNNGCPFYSLVTIYFLDEPDVSFDIEIVNDCVEPGISIIMNNLTDNEFRLSGMFNGTPFEFDVITGESRIILDMVLEGENTILLTSYHFAILPSCSFELSEEIIVELSPVLIFPDILQVCNEAAGEMGTSLDFSDIFNYPVEIVSINLDGFTGEIAIPIVDFMGVSPGEYEFEVVFDPQNGCPVFDTIIQIDVQDCSCPFLINGNIEYDFCGLNAIDLNDFVVGEWQITWNIVSTPPGAVLNIEDGVLDFGELFAGLYEFSGVVDDVPDGCDPNISLLLNANELFNAGELIQEDTIIICLEGEEDEIQLFEYIQDYDLNGQWSKLTENGAIGSLDDQTGRYNLSGFGKTVVSFTYSGSASDECSFDSTILHVIVYRNMTFDIPDQFEISCDENVVVIDIGQFAELEGWTLNITALEGEFEYFNGGNTIRVNTASVIQFEFLAENSRCNYLYEVTVLLVGNPITNIALNVEAPICLSDEGDGLIEVEEIIGGVGPFEVNLNGSTLNNPPYIFDNLRSGSYLLNITDTNGCIYDSLVQLVSEQTGFISLGDDLFVTSGIELDIDFETNIASDNVGSIFWELDDEIICEDCTSVQIIAAQGQMVMLTLTDLNGCIYRDSLFIFADIQIPFYLPNAFSPNLDNINEKLLIYPRAGLVEVLEWKIYDRWGSSVFESGPFNPFAQEIGWDGQYRGRSVLPGVYISSIRYLISNGRSVYHVSEVNLLR